MKKRKLIKSAVTGKFVSKRNAQENPRETYETTARPRLIKRSATAAVSSSKMPKGPATGNK